MTNCDHLAAIANYRDVRARLRNGPLPVVVSEPPAIEPAVVEDEIIDAEPTRRTMKEILSHVAEKYNIPTYRIKSNAQDQTVCRPRHEACWIMNKEMDFSLTQIGKFFSRDHTTVLSAIKRHQARIDAGEVTL